MGLMILIRDYFSGCRTKAGATCSPRHFSIVDKQISPLFSTRHISRGMIHNSYTDGLLTGFIPNENKKWRHAHLSFMRWQRHKCTIDTIIKYSIFLRVCVIFAMATAVVAATGNEGTTKLTTMHALAPLSLFISFWKDYIRDYIDYINRWTPIKQSEVLYG